MKNPLRVLLLSLFLAAVSGLAAQQEFTGVAHLHTLYATDGSVWKGEIIDWNPEYTTLRLLTGVEIEVNANEIRRIVSLSSGESKTGTKFLTEPVFKDRGIYNVSTVGASAGPNLGVSVTHATGYRFAQAFGLGGGMGLESFDVGSGNQMLPIFVEARGFLMKKNLSPYYAVRVGHGFTLSNTETNVTEAKGGAMFHAELGYRFGCRRAASFFTGLAMHWQNAQYLYEWPWESIFYDRVTFRRTELRFGVIF